MTQRLGALFVNQNIEDRSAVAGATNRFLETQLEESRSKLEAQEKLLEDFRQQHGHELPTQTQANVQSLSSAQLQAQSLVESVARDRDRKQMLERLHNEAAIEPAAAPAVSPARSAAIHRLVRRCRSSWPPPGRTWRRSSSATSPITRTWPGRDDRSPSFSRRPSKRRAPRPPPAPTRRPRSPVVVDANEQARRERLRGMAAEIESLDRQIAFKEAEERRVRAEITEYQRRLEAVPQLESAWVKLTRDYDTQQLAYRELLTKSTAAQVAANLEGQDIGERFRIVDPALGARAPDALDAHPLQRHGPGIGPAHRPGRCGAARVQGSELLDGGRRPRRPVAAGARGGAATWRPPPTSSARDGGGSWPRSVERFAWRSRAMWPGPGSCGTA